MELEKVNSETKSMYAKEEETLKQLLELETEFRNYYAALLKEMKLQRESAERMSYLSQRYLMLVSTGTCCSKFSEAYSAPSEDVILHEYHTKLIEIRSSNCRLWHALRGLRYACRQFEQLCSELDMSRETPLIIGDAFHKPISYFIELVDDLFKYLHTLLLGLKYRSHLMDPADLIVLEEYKKLLEPSEDFEEYLIHGLVYCKCLRPKPLCELKSIGCKAKQQKL